MCFRKEDASTMNFRQRIAWLLVAVYLVLTSAIVYYIFDINDGYSAYALEHVERDHDKKSTSGKFWTTLGHLMDIPLPLWILILVLPYLQVFCMLLACTKSNPQFSMAYLWPFYIYFRCKKLYMDATTKGRVPKATNSPIPNGHLVIDT